MNRRNVLAAAGTALPAVLGGCLADGSTSAQAADSSGDSDDTPSLPEGKGPVRGQSDADVTAREVEDRDHITYVPENDTIQYVAAWRHTNHEEVEAGEKPKREAVYDTISFDEWAERRCVFAAARAAADHVRSELDVAESRSISGGVSSRVEGEESAAVVESVEAYDRDGNLVHETGVEFEALVAATPKTVTATYVFGDRETRLDVPIYARHVVLQQS
ncbi:MULTISPECIES: hypothetical protein [Haloferax]|uniref:Uncharacterized protein n=1 Tax=Haloferax marinum TaxID=2666143 RepID=A0A6A8G7L9_9EURY|nr:MULTISPECIES: hypothetical protein [Haloferax]KAB1198016.1 hypothetical protein Hfx1150_10990 [Haloferax sp. CBA1150]MRW97084.1 hypothetical protein [Haloferax marinum]